MLTGRLSLLGPLLPKDISWLPAGLPTGIPGGFPLPTPEWSWRFDATRHTAQHLIGVGLATSQ
jgi:hypothetical protein